MTYTDTLAAAAYIMQEPAIFMLLVGFAAIGVFATWLQVYKIFR